MYASILLLPVWSLFYFISFVVAREDFILLISRSTGRLILLTLFLIMWRLEEDNYNNVQQSAGNFTAIYLACDMLPCIKVTQRQVVTIIFQNRGGLGAPGIGREEEQENFAVDFVVIFYVCRVSL